MRRLLASAVTLCFLTALANAYSVSEIARIDRLLQVLDQRLRISDQVARAKWNSRAPIEDAAREAQVLEGFAQQAASAGLDSDWAREIMRAQIEASKIRQRQLFQQWRIRRQPAFTNPPDLASEIRPQLDDLSVRLLESLRQTRPLLDHDPSLLHWRAGIVWGEDPDLARLRALQAW